MWAAVVVAAAGCYALKVAGLSVPGRLLDHPRMQRIAALLPVALLAALAATQTFADKRDLVFDARVAGVAAAVLAIRMRASFLAVVGVAAATTAVVRAAG